MPKKESDLEKFLPALAALARGAAGGAMRRGMAAGGGGGGGDEDASGGPSSPDSDLAANISDMNRNKMYKAEPEPEPVHEDVNNAVSRLKLLGSGGGTAGQMAEEIGFDPSKPMPKPKVTSANHAEGAGVPLDNQGFTVTERDEMKKADRAISRQITEENKQKQSSKPKRNKQASIENSLLKLIKAHEDPDLLSPARDEYKRQGRLTTVPETDTPKSEITQGKLPMSEAEERNLGHPNIPFKQGWITGKVARDKRETIDNRRAAPIEDALLKLMKAPPQPGTPPGAPVKPNKPIVATPGASGGGTPGAAAGAPGGAVKTAPQTNPQVQQPASFQIQHAKRPIQASIDKTDFPDGLSNAEWEQVMDEKIKRETFGEEHQPESKNGKYAEPNIQNIQNALLKIMKAPTDLAGQARAARQGKHEQGKAKTAGAIKGQEETSQRGIGEMRQGAGQAEQDAAKTTGLGADIVGQSIGTASWMAGLGQRSDSPPGAPSGFMPDANTPGDVGANDNQATPPQGSVGSGDTGMPETPKPNTASQTVANLARTTKPQPQSNPVDAALGRIKPNP